jgi:hypothetical protein
MKPQTRDITGVRFGRLTPISVSYSPDARWLCQCDCGNRKDIAARNLFNGRTRSCGCLHVENHTTHGYSNRPEYACWKNLIARCTRPNLSSWAGYGGRGIRVCDEWRKSFEAFHRDMGDRPGAGFQIDRIDNDGDYEPGNCRWVTLTQQLRNKRTSRLVEWDGRRVTVAEAAELSGLAQPLIHGRLKRGCPPERLFTSPAPRAKRVHK